MKTVPPIVCVGMMEKVGTVANELRVVGAGGVVGTILDATLTGVEAIEEEGVGMISAREVEGRFVVRIMDEVDGNAASEVAATGVSGV